ncbi:hypothetical protein [Crossiella sp. NPDC003009]
MSQREHRPQRQPSAPPRQTLTPPASAVTPFRLNDLDTVGGAPLAGDDFDTAVRELQLDLLGLGKFDEFPGAATEPTARHRWLAAAVAERIRRALGRYPNLSFTVQGRGGDADLMRARAESIRKLLVAQGVKAELLREYARPAEATVLLSGPVQIGIDGTSAAGLLARPAPGPRGNRLRWPLGPTPSSPQAEGDRPFPRTPGFPKLKWPEQGKEPETGADTLPEFGQEPDPAATSLAGALVKVPFVREVRQMFDQWWEQQTTPRGRTFLGEVTVSVDLQEVLPADRADLTAQLFAGLNGQVTLVNGRGWLLVDLPAGGKAVKVGLDLSQLFGLRPGPVQLWVRGVPMESLQLWVGGRF